MRVIEHGVWQHSFELEAEQSRDPQQRLLGRLKNAVQRSFVERQTTDTVGVSIQVYCVLEEAYRPKMKHS